MSKGVDRGWICVLENHGELVTTPTRNQNVAANQAPQPVRDCAEHFVADCVSPQVVHKLEVIEVEKQ